MRHASLPNPHYGSLHLSGLFCCGSGGVGCTCFLSLPAIFAAGDYLPAQGIWMVLGKGRKAAIPYVHVSLICMQRAGQTVKRGLWDPPASGTCLTVFGHRAVSDGSLHSQPPNCWLKKTIKDARLTAAGVRVFRLGFPHLFSKV